MLVVRDLGKSFDNTPLFSQVNLQVDEGQMVALCGPSGCGKTTLLNAIGLLEPVETGEILYKGKRIPKVGSIASVKLLRREFGYLFQNFALIDNETVEYNIRLAQKYVKQSASLKNERRMIALDKVGLKDFSRRKVFTLSGGEQQRIAIARLMVKECSLILADEPTGSLDSTSRNTIIAAIRTLCDQGKSAIIVTHDYEVAEQCDRIIQLGTKAPSKHLS